MDINYKNLSSFEALGIFVAAIGLVLGFVFMFCALPDQQRTEVRNAVSFLDIHEQAGAELMAVGNIFGYTHEFLDQVYVAFSQLAVVPIPDYRISTTVAEVSNALGSYADEFTLNYESNNAPLAEIGEINPGKVLGAMIQANTSPKTYSDELNIPYSFKAPSFEIKIHRHASTNLSNY